MEDPRPDRVRSAEDTIIELHQRIERMKKPMTMQDVRLMAGEGKLTPHDVLAAANAVLRLRAGG